MSKTKRSKTSADEDDDDLDLYIPDSKNASKLVQVSPSKEPRIRKYLSLGKPDLQKWLRHNGQLVTGRKEDLLLRCIDGEINGRIPGCPACHKGQMFYSYEEGAYVCNGYWDDMARVPIRCGHIETKVKREPWRDIEKDPAVAKGEAPHSASSGADDAHDKAHHHSGNPDHHHTEHNCVVEANHDLVDLLEDMAYYHSVLKDENWGYKARAFIAAARAVEHLPFEIDGKSHQALNMGNPRDAKHHVERIGKSSAEVMQAFLDSGKQRSPHLEEFKASLKAQQNKSNGGEESGEKKKKKQGDRK
jgi:hypothetical protein